jgi:heat shock protein HslJ
MKHLVLIIGIIFTLISCSSQQQQTMEQKQNQETNWVLTHMNNEKISFNTTLKFDKTNYSGRAACNGYRGAVTKLTASALTFGDAMATRMACPNLDKEQGYFNNLQTVSHYKIENNILILYNKENKLLLVFTKA